MHLPAFIWQSIRSHDYLIYISKHVLYKHPLNSFISSFSFHICSHLPHIPSSHNLSSVSSLCFTFCHSSYIHLAFILLQSWSRLQTSLCFLLILLSLFCHLIISSLPFPSLLCMIYTSSFPMHLPFFLAVSYTSSLLSFLLLFFSNKPDCSPFTSFPSPSSSIFPPSTKIFNLCPCARGDVTHTRPTVTQIPLLASYRPEVNCWDWWWWRWCFWWWSWWSCSDER